MAQWTLVIGVFGIWSSRGVDIGFQKITIVQVMSVVGFLQAMYSVATQKITTPYATRMTFERLLVLYVIVLTALVLSIVNAAEPLDSVRFIGRWVYGMMLVVAVFVMTDGNPAAMRRMIRAFIYGGLVSTVVCYAAFRIPALGGIVFQDIWTHRAQGFLEHPNQLGMLYLAAILLAFWPKLFNFYVRVAVVLALVAGLALTGSKFNIAVALLIVPIIMFWLPAREGRLSTAGLGLMFGAPLGILLVLIAAITIQANSSSYFHRLQTFVDNPAGSETSISRVDLYIQAFNCWKHHPFLGVGAGNASLCTLQQFPHVHNVFLNYMLESGVVGLVAFCIFLAFVLFSMNQTANDARLLPGTIFGKNDTYRGAGLVLISSLGYVMSNCSSDSMGPATMPFLWMNIGLMLSMHRYIIEFRLRPPA